MKLAEEREEGYAEGRAEGRAEGHLDAVRNLMETMNLTMEQAMAALKIPMEELEHYQEPKAATYRLSINNKKSGWEPDGSVRFLPTLGYSFIWYAERTFL